MNFPNHFFHETLYMVTGVLKNQDQRRVAVILVRAIRTKRAVENTLVYT